MAVPIIATLPVEKALIPSSPAHTLPYLSRHGLFSAPSRRDIDFQRLSLFRAPVRTIADLALVHTTLRHLPSLHSPSISAAILFACACVSPSPASARGPAHVFRALATCTSPACLLRPPVSLTCAVSSPLGQDTGLGPKMGSLASLSRTLLRCHDQRICASSQIAGRVPQGPGWAGLSKTSPTDLQEGT